MHRAIGEKRPGAANRAITLCSSMFSRAEDWGWIPLRSNPCYRMRRYKERKMERFLSPVERARLESVLVAAEKATKGAPEYLGPGNVLAVRLLALTGCRKSEISNLRWSHVDLEHAELRLPDTKTGLSLRPLTPQAVALLRALRAQAPVGQGLVCVSETGERLHGVGRAWLAIRRRAGLDDVRLHDLRHSAASDALAAGVPLAMVGAMLGHKSPATTARYAHLADEHRKRAATMMGDAIERSTREGADALLALVAADHRAEVTGPTKTIH
jgi:integrase